MVEHFDTVVIGAGQAGLATSYYLTQHRHNHVVLEKARIGEAWRSGKWDSFTLVTPNWSLRLPGFPYQGDAPDGFLTREEAVGYLDEYVRSFNPPVRQGIAVTAVRDSGNGFHIETRAGQMHANNVVIATGSFQSPKIPAFAADIAPHIHQLHSSEYRNAQQLPAGGVLVVGGGQSGCQIAYELRMAGRQTYLSAGKVGSLPRRYRGRDAFWWAEKIGMLDRHVDKLPSPGARFVGNPQLTGCDGGQSLDLHRLAAAGVVPVGRTLGANGTKLFFAPDLQENLAFADKFAAEFLEGLEEFIAATAMDAPPDKEPVVRAGYDVPLIPEFDLDAVGVTSIVWAAGYRFDFSWVHFPLYDEYGYPMQQRGITAQPGLYFVGLQWLHSMKSALFAGVGEDAEYIVNDIMRRTG